MLDSERSAKWSRADENRSLVGEFVIGLRELWQYRYLALILIRNRTRDRYHGSALGVLWSLVNPVLMMLGLALIFPLIAKFTMPNYVGFLLSGVLAWGFISNACLIGGDCYLVSEGFIRNVYLPRLLLPVVFVSTEAITLIIGSVALLLLGWTLNFGVLFRPITLVTAIILTYLFCMGIVLGLSVALVYFRDLKNIIGVVLQALFYLSGIIYPISILPENYQILMEFNPFFQFIRLFHIAIYGGDNLWNSIGTASITVILSLIIGFYINIRYAKYVIFRL